MIKNAFGDSGQKQQGDVLLLKVCSLPAGTKPVSRQQRGFVLAEGEVTGHAHVIADDIKLFSDGTGALFVETDHEVEIKHEEHGTIKLDAGIWKVGKVREYDHLNDLERQVMD